LQYPSDVNDEERVFCVPYLTRMKEDALKREYPLGELFNGLHRLVGAWCPWRIMPNDLPPGNVVQPQTQRWLRAGCFEALTDGLRLLQRCQQLQIQRVTLHSYRDACAERAKMAGYLERFAREALGHNSKAVHRAYA